MSPLPVGRLESFNPAFMHSGLDFFGPFAVVLHRRSHKRYCCLFTCLTTRAVHIEVTWSLDTNFFLLAFRRFVNLPSQLSEILLF